MLWPRMTLLSLDHFANRYSCSKSPVKEKWLNEQKMSIPEEVAQVQSRLLVAAGSTSLHRFKANSPWVGGLRHGLASSAQSQHRAESMLCEGCVKFFPS